MSMRWSKAVVRRKDECKVPGDQLPQGWRHFGVKTSVPLPFWPVIVQSPCSDPSGITL